ncbi:MAG TPA: hypothetical protein VFZ80_07260, partial [Acidimicrobiia bacterium]
MKVRTLCVWFPMWSLAVARKTRQDAPSGEPVLVADDRVTGATEDVLEAGVSLGMPRREAEALAPFATVLNRDIGEETRHFEPVVAVVEELVPRVEVVSPGLLFVPVAGAVKFYGGEKALAVKVEEALREHLEDEDTSEASAGAVSIEGGRRLPIWQAGVSLETPYRSSEAREAPSARYARYPPPELRSGNSSGWDHHLG